jgi:hypothetical protein
MDLELFGRPHAIGELMVDEEFGTAQIHRSFLPNQRVPMSQRRHDTPGSAIKQVFSVFISFLY